MKTLACPNEGCTHTKLPIKLLAEEAIVQSGKKLTRKPKALMRNFSMVCPDHGELWVQVEGHHVSNWHKIAPAAKANAGIVGREKCCPMLP